MSSGKGLEEKERSNKEKEDDEADDLSESADDLFLDVDLGSAALELGLVDAAVDEEALDEAEDGANVVDLEECDAENEGLVALDAADLQLDAERDFLLRSSSWSIAFESLISVARRFGPEVDEDDDGVAVTNRRGTFSSSESVSESDCRCCCARRMSAILDSLDKRRRFCSSSSLSVSDSLSSDDDEDDDDESLSLPLWESLSDSESERPPSDSVSSSAISPNLAASVSRN